MSCKFKLSKILSVELVPPRPVAQQHYYLGLLREPVPDRIRSETEYSIHGDSSIVIQQINQDTVFGSTKEPERNSPLWAHSQVATRSLCLHLQLIELNI